MQRAAGLALVTFAVAALGSALLGAGSDCGCFGRELAVSASERLALGGFLGAMGCAKLVGPRGPPVS